MSIGPEDCGKEVDVRCINISARSDDIHIAKRTVEAVITGPKGKLVLYANPFPCEKGHFQDYERSERHKYRAIKVFMKGQR